MSLEIGEVVHVCVLCIAVPRRPFRRRHRRPYLSAQGLALGGAHWARWAPSLSLGALVEGLDALLGGTLGLGLEPADLAPGERVMRAQLSSLYCRLLECVLV